MKLGMATSPSSREPLLIAGLGSSRALDVAALARRVDPSMVEGGGALGSLKALLQSGPEMLGRVQQLVSAHQPQDGEVFAEQDLVFLPPIGDAGKFLCVGKNYRAHLDELVKGDLIKEIPNEPTGFIKLNSVLVGHGAKVSRPPDITMFDYEPELAFVIGRPAYRVNKADALSYVAGVTLFNDLTAREIQKREVVSGTKFWMAKNMPGFGPLGPYMATFDEFADVDDLGLACTVNGVSRVRFNTSGMINKIPDIIEHFSRFMPLEPGDIFATGCAAGTAFSQPNAAELFLKPGDLVEAELEGLMSLTTHIVEAPATTGA